MYVCLGRSGCRYTFKVSMHSKARSTAARCTALLKQLKEMIKEERAASTRSALRPPDAPAFSCTLSVPKLGTVSAARKVHEKAAEERMAAMIDTEDDEELVALDNKYKDALFYDADWNEYRVINDVEYNATCTDKDGELSPRFEAVTVKVYAPGHERAGKEMAGSARSEQPYGLAPSELAEMDRMVAAYEVAVAQAAQKKKRKREGKGQGKGRRNSTTQSSKRKKRR